MQKKTAKIIIPLISAALTLTLMFSECLIAYAADGSEKASISKGTTIFIMVSVFIVTALITSYISFKLRVKKLRQQSEKNSSENSKE